MRERPTIVVIGAGSSSFGLSALREIYGEPALAGSELWLVDLDAARAQRTAEVAEAFEHCTGRGITVRCSTDRLEALPGADAVILAVEVDRQHRWEQDAEICRRNGVEVVLAENAGPGGLSHALRTIPLVAGIARDVERLAPGAWLLNFTNPEGRICTALQRHLPDVRAVGLCHEVRLAGERHARALGRPWESLRLRAGGLNHITALLECTDARTGEVVDLSRSLTVLLGDEHEGPQHQLVRQLNDSLHTLVATTDNHVGEYVAWATDHTPIVDVTGWEGGIRASEEALVAAVLGRSFDLTPLVELPPIEALVPILRALITGESSRVASVILPNHDLLPQLQGDCAVEVSATVTGDGPVGDRSVDLEEPFAALLRTEITIQQLVADAALLGSREAAVQALLLDPFVGSSRTADALLRDLEVAHRDLWPALT